jgi:hypothetical protein
MKNLIITFLLVGVIGTGAYFAKSLNPKSQPVTISNPQQNTEQDTIEPEKDDESTAEDTVKLITQAGLDFKIEIQQEPRNLIIYQKVGNDWSVMDTIEYDGYYKRLNEQVSFSDWNKDGYVDILTHGRTGFKLYLFDFNKKRFVETGVFSEVTPLEDGFAYNYTYIRPVWQSELYRIENFKKVTYATLLLTFDNSKPRQLLLYEGDYKDNNVIETIPPESVPDYKEVGFNAFDYDNYWKKNWKRLIK